MFDFGHHPGLLFVWATLLPLLSFLGLALFGAVRMYCRTNHPLVYESLGGDMPAKWPAYVATAAIAGAFVLCLTGFVLFLRDQAHHHAGAHGEEAAAKADDHSHQGSAAQKGSDPKWAQSVQWAILRPAGSADKSHGTILSVGYRIDHLSAVMFVMVTFIATLIHLFSIGYMSEELSRTVEDHQVHTAGGHLHRRGRFGRFFLFLSLFCFSMLNLVLADNLFQVFVSWELVGVCSYLLIGFYYERTSASNAANKAFITNRVGDAGFIIGLLILWTSVGTLNFEDMFQRVRAPLQDSHAEPVVGAGRVIRGEVDGTTFKVMEGGSQALVMPRNLAHFHHDAFEPDSEITVREAPGQRQYGYLPYWMLVVAGLGVFLGCVGKSAQFPLQVWLPDAMEGPTPVSALIHAATMVAAGVYLVGRCFPLFTPEALLVIAYTGGITLFVAATIAIVMTDIKKVLAYSTVSQLGYMMLALGVGGWAAGLFHLVTHAFFKALLFLGSGSVIYGCHHEQEMTKMGGLRTKMPITAYTMLMGVLAIAGIPLFSGWYSKDAVLASALGFAIVNKQHFLLFVLPLATAGITTFYMFRMWFMTFTGKPRDHHVYEHAHESPQLMTVPLVLLAAGSIFVGWGNPPWNAEASALEHTIHHAQPNSVVAEFGRHTDHDPRWAGGATLSIDRSPRHQALEFHDLAGLLALGTVTLGIAFAVALYSPRRALDPADAAEQFGGLHSFLKHKWHFDEAYSALLVRPSLVAAHWCRWFDATVIDGFINGLGHFSVRVARWDGLFDARVIDGLVNVVGNAIHAVGGRLRSVQTGYLRSYVLFLALGAVAIFLVLSYFVTLAGAR